MTEVEVVQDAATLERELSPAILSKRLRGKSVDTCVATYESLKDLVANTVVSALACVGEAARTHEVGIDKAKLKSIATSFGVAISTASRAVRSYETIVIPKIEKMGVSAVFKFDEVSWFFLSVDAAERLERPALEIYEMAEERAAENGNYSTRDFRRDLEKMGSDEGSTSSDAPSVDRALGRIAEMNADDWAAWAANRKDVKDKLARAEDAATAATDAAKALRDRAENRLS